MLPRRQYVLMIHKFLPLYRHGSRNEANNFNTQSVKKELSYNTGRTGWTGICTSMHYPKSPIRPAHHSEVLVGFANTCPGPYIKILIISRNWLIEIHEMKIFLNFPYKKLRYKMYCIYSLFLSCTNGFKVNLILMMKRFAWLFLKKDDDFKH